MPKLIKRSIKYEIMRGVQKLDEAAKVVNEW